MAYCTPAQVAEEFKDLEFTGETVITSTRVTRFIAEADARINGILSKRYLTPITGTEALLIVREISTKLVAGRVQKIIKVKTGEEKARQDGQSGDLADEAKQLLKDIVNDEIRLTDADLATSHQGVQSYANDNDLEAVFTMEDDAW